GNGLAGVQNLGAGAMHGVDELARQGGDAAQALQYVENHALAAEQHARVVADDGNGLPLLQADPVKNFSMADDFGMADHVRIELLVHFQNAADRAHAGKNAVLLGQDRRRGSLLRIDARPRSCVTGGLVLQQRVLQNGGNSSTMPIHTSTDTAWQSPNSKSLT